MAIWNEDDWVEVKKSTCGYTGPGQLVSLAYGTTWLVRVEWKDQTRVITVKAQYLGTGGVGVVVKKKK